MLSKVNGPVIWVPKSTPGVVPVVAVVITAPGVAPFVTAIGVHVTVTVVTDVVGRLQFVCTPAAGKPALRSCLSCAMAAAVALATSDD